MMLWPKERCERIIGRQFYVPFYFRHENSETYFVAMADGVFQLPSFKRVHKPIFLRKYTGCIPLNQGDEYTIVLPIAVSAVIHQLTCHLGIYARGVVYDLETGHSEEYTPKEIRKLFYICPNREIVISMPQRYA